MKSLQTRLLLMIGVIVMINILSEQFYFRLDFTGDQRYTLGEATKDILSDLEEPVTITAYFTSADKLPAHIARVKEDFRDLLLEYANYSDEQVVFEFIDPNEDEETEREAQQSGIQPILINVREKDEVAQVKAYLGAVIQSGEQKDVMPFIQPGAAMEYALSSSIKKVTIVDKTKIGLLQGHGEPSLSALNQTVNVLRVLYDVETVELSDTAAIDPGFGCLAIIAPTEQFPQSHLDQLDQFLQNGGRLYVGINRVNGDFQASNGSPITTGLETWLENKGVIVEEKFLIDSKCGSVSVRQQQGFFSIQTPVQFPFLPLISKFADHPISKGLEGVMLPFASPITYAPADSSIQYDYLGYSSKKSGTQPGTTYFNFQKQWNNTDFQLSRLPIGVAIEGNIAGTSLSKMVVFGDGDFAVNGEGQGAQQLQQDNVSLFVNSIEWLSDDTGLNELRTKAVTSRPIDEDIDDSKKTMIKWVNFLLPILLIIIYGFVRMQMRSRLRNKWMETRYA